MNLDKIRVKILVLGDSGVGKSSLIHLICHSTVLNSPQSTIGCSIDVKIHNNYVLEFWDVGGSRSHKIARSFLYQDYKGIILVFDATNKKSRLNLNEWLAEVCGNVPTLTIATKTDLIPHNVRSKDDDNILSMNTQGSFSPGSWNYDLLNNFFNLLEHRH